MNTDDRNISKKAEFFLKKKKVTIGLKYKLLAKIIE